MTDRLWHSPHRDRRTPRRETQSTDGDDVMIPLCDRCNDTGFVTVRNHWPMAYVCAGSPPEDARGVCEAPCRECPADACENRSMKNAKPVLELLPVEEGIPIPPPNYFPKYRKPPKYLYGLERLEINQSIFIPDARNAPMSAINKCKSRYGRLFNYRLYYDANGSISGCRVWRTY